MHKNIKKIVSFLGWTVFLFVLLGILVTVLINSNRGQNFLTGKTLERLENKLENSLSCSEVRFRLFNKLEMKDLLVTDLAGDTIIFAKNLKASFPGLIKNIVLKKDLPVKIGGLTFDNSYFRIYNDSTQTPNIKFITDKLKAGKDTTVPPKPFYLNRITIKNSRFALVKYDTATKRDGIDFSRMLFNDLNIKVTDLRVFTDTLSMQIRRLEFNEKSGFRMKSFDSDLHLCNQHLYFKDVNMQMDDSELKSVNVNFDFNDFKDFGGGKVFEKVKVKIRIGESDINMRDVGYFARIFQDMDYKVRLGGFFYGTLSELKARKLELGSGGGTLLRGQFNMSGLPDISNTFLFFEIKEFKTNVEDINALKLPGNKQITLPEAFREIKTFNYKGDFTGFFRDFVSYGEIKTEHGNVMTDLLFAPDSNNLVTFSGRLQTSHFNVGVLTKSPDMVGAISLDMNIDGQGRIEGGFDVDLKGEISKFEVNKYNYSDITVDGNFSENRFNGKLEINDENAKVEFDGLLDLSSEVRRYNFQANVYHADLYGLNIHENDSNYTGSFLIKADLAGNTVNEINGKVKLINSFFTKSDAQIQVYDLQLDIINDSLKNELRIKSDFLDGEVSGNFNVTQLADEYISYASGILPALSFKEKATELDDSANFHYSLRFKNSLPMFNFFLPEYRVYPKTKISGFFKRDSVIGGSIHLESPEIRIKKIGFTDVVLNSTLENEKVDLDFGSISANLNNRISLDNFSLITFADSNNINFSTRWMNWDTVLYKGAIKGQMSFLNDGGEKIKSLVEFDSSAFVISDSSWTFDAFDVLIDSSSLQVKNFNLRHKDEYILIDGMLTDNAPDSLFCTFKDFDFSNLNSFTRSEQLRFGGILSGDIKIQGFRKPLFFAEMFIQELNLNNEPIGNTEINSYWSDEKSSLTFDADVFRGKLNTLNLRGDIYPLRGNEMDLTLNFNKFKLNFVNPYLDNVFDDVRGLATGRVTISGTTRKPKLNGGLNLQKAILTVDYLNTRYNFTSMLGISNNNLVFDNILLNDEYGNTATLNGLIRTDYFKSFNLNLSLKADNFLFLNTTQNENESFYGKAFATGLVRINGETSALKIDVSARTEKGTDFNVPLSGSEELAEYTFIKFVDSDSLKTEQEVFEYDVNLTGMQLDFNLKVTPEAKVKIIFDPTMGDIIEATGKGDMRIAINTAGDLQIIGEYEIEQGDYLFTLKDMLINKKFKVERGSTVRWTGDPVNADIDINTFYRTKASLNDLNPVSFEGLGNVTTDCQLELSGKLLQPDIGYDIYLPYSDQGLRSQVASLITTQEEKGKQFLSLLILSRFFYSGPASTEEGSIGGGDIAGVNASELLSNQLSNWLSQISNDFDVGVSYRPGTEISPQEVEVALSTQLLNDRLSINGSVDMKTNAEVQETNSIVGDVDIDYKITKNGKIRARVFNKANEEESIEDFSTKYTQGIGIFYTEEFDKFGEVIDRYKKGFSKGKKDKKKKNKIQSGNDQAIKDEDEDKPK